MTIDDFSGAAVFQTVTERASKQRLPQPNKPRFADPTYDFPEDPSQVTTTQLGQLMLQMAAFNGWTQRLYGVVDSELVGLEAEYRLKIDAYSLDVRQQLEGRPAANVVEAAVLKAHPELMPLFTRRTELRTALSKLDSHLKMYQGHNAALSRELTRREVETRLR